MHTDLNISFLFSLQFVILKNNFVKYIQIKFSDIIFKLVHSFAAIQFFVVI